ncbi:MAG: DMT family transporter [Lachnospiraceae bacterium]|nr:DMT family transporter [Lachnospiraceae bacterium]MDE7177906.1 DMT family transporter [Lachnospiraceae bacterium]
MLGFWIAILSGALMSIQGVFNTQVTKQSGIWVANAFVQLTALLVCLAVWLASDRTSFASLLKVEPKYMLLGGAIGTFITYTVIKSMEQLGPARSVMFIVVSQLIIAYVIEILGLFGVEKQPLEMKKLLGAGVMIVGIVIFKWT